MIETKRQYDHIVGALSYQNIERTVPTEPNGPVVEAFVSGSQLFVASHDAAGKRWTPVQRETLADGLRTPHSQQPQGGHHDVSSQAHPPAMPATIAPSQMHLKPIAADALIFHAPTLWDVDYTDFLVDEPHHDDAPAQMQQPAGYPPLALWPIAPARAGHDTSQPAPQQPPGMSSGMSVFALEKMVDVAPAARPSRKTSAVRAAARLAYHQQPVDPETGKPANKGAAHTITRREFQERKRSIAFIVQRERGMAGGARPHRANGYLRLVDPETGEEAAPGATNAITQERFLIRKKNNSLVDPATGLAPTSPSIPTVTFAYFKNHELLDARTGKRATAETEETITRAGYAKRKWLANRERQRRGDT